MAWGYSQSTGMLTLDDEAVAQGYSGKGVHKNDPESQCVKNQGPLPRGLYTIRPMQVDGGHMGPNVLPLVPDATNDMCDRDGFFIHGDNADHTASDGCIILGKDIRQKIAASSDKQLIVTA